MPGEDGSAHLENDVTQVQLPVNTEGANRVDPNPFFGRVAYTHGLSLDRPLSLIRMGYGDLIDETGVVRPHRSLAPFAVMPLWTANGQADNGTFSDGGILKCETSGGVVRCVSIQWPAHFYLQARQSLRRGAWHGSVVEDKKDAAGTFYRRNRVYDPATGRFTQEDPIGLAGGLNLYGFAGGDPVNFSDPFGLSCKDAMGNDVPCQLSDLFTYTVTIGGQIGATVTVGGVGAYARVQVGPVVGVRMTRSGSEPVEMPSNGASVEGGAQLPGNASFGVRCDLAGGCQSTGSLPNADFSPTSTRSMRGSGKGTTKVGVSAGVGMSLELNTDAAKELAKRYWHQVRSMLPGGRNDSRWKGPEHVRGGWSRTSLSPREISAAGGGECEPGTTFCSESVGGADCVCLLHRMGIGRVSLGQPVSR